MSEVPENIGMAFACYTHKTFIGVVAVLLFAACNYEYIPYRQYRQNYSESNFDYYD
ncbi:MAG: hypothetical protein ACLTZI_16220 [[Eubacterium] siraeum]